MKAWLNLRHQESKRGQVFTAGLRNLGFEVCIGVTADPGPKDILVTWNRIGLGDVAARSFESRGLSVIVAENAAWGNDFLGRQWLTLSNNFHNTAGLFPVGNKWRWDDLKVQLQPWRQSGETVILPQRGIGPKEVAMPSGWADQAYRQFKGRVRRHPGKTASAPLEVDLARCGHVVTWGSGAAIKALMWGVKVTSQMPNWIGKQNNTDEGRIEMFRRLAWANFETKEIENASAIARLLRC